MTITRTNPMTKAMEVITSVERRRRWSRAEKERIVAAAMEPGAVASEIARAAGIHSSQLFRWRQQLCKRAQLPAAFNPVAVYASGEGHGQIAFGEAACGVKQLSCRCSAGASSTAGARGSAWRDDRASGRACRRARLAGRHR